MAGGNCLLIWDYVLRIADLPAWVWQFLPMLVEDCLCLDLAVVGAGQHRCEGALQWHIGGAVLLNAVWSLEESAAGDRWLRIRFGTREAGWIRQRVQLTSTQPHFGGARWWFLCPATGRRVRCLYLAPNAQRFLSRQAVGLSYRIERIGGYDRALARLCRAQKGLTDAPGLAATLTRPKGMWRRSWAKRLAACELAGDECGAALLGMMVALMRNEGRTSSENGTCQPLH